MRGPAVTECLTGVQPPNRAKALTGHDAKGARPRAAQHVGDALAEVVREGALLEGRQAVGDHMPHVGQIPKRAAHGRGGVCKTEGGRALASVPGRAALDPRRPPQSSSPFPAQAAPLPSHGLPPPRARTSLPRGGHVALHSRGNHRPPCVTSARFGSRSRRPFSHFRGIPFSGRLQGEAPLLPLLQGSAPAGRGGPGGGGAQPEARSTQWDSRPSAAARGSPAFLPGCGAVGSCRDWEARRGVERGARGRRGRVVPAEP